MAEDELVKTTVIRLDEILSRRTPPPSERRSSRLCPRLSRERPKQRLQGQRGPTGVIG